MSGADPDSLVLQWPLPASVLRSAFAVRARVFVFEPYMISSSFDARGSGSNVAKNSSNVVNALQGLLEAICKSKIRVILPLSFYFSTLSLFVVLFYLFMYFYFSGGVDVRVRPRRARASDGASTSRGLGPADDGVEAHSAPRLPSG